jgi:hypothetical protein
LNEITEVRVIKKKWFPKTGNNQRELEQQLVPQRSCLTKAVERALLTKGLRVIVAASVALGASFLIHPNLAVIIVPVSTALYAREITSIWRKRHSANKNQED